MKPLAFAVLLLVACRGESDGPAALAVARADSAGVAIVTDPGTNLDQPLDVMLAAEPHLRIGTIDGGEETQFTAIRSVSRLSDGRILVLGTNREPLRLFDSDGRFLAWIGRIGQGPGEYRAPSAAGVLPGDTIWVADSNRKFELFTPDGASLGTLPLDRPRRIVDTIQMLPSGHVLAIHTEFPPGLAMGVYDTEQIAYVGDRGGSAEIEVGRGPGSRFMRSPAARGGWVSRATYGEVFRPHPFFEVARDAVLRLDPGTFEIRWIAVDGTPRRILRVDTEPRPFTQAMLDEDRARHFSQATTPEQRQSLEGWMSSVSRPEWLPFFDRALWEDDGRVWLRQYRLPVEQAEGGSDRWWRVSIEDGLDGYLTVPAGLAPAWVGGDEVLGVVRDDFDVPYLVAYRLVPR
jgi:hypothetical protein